MEILPDCQGKGRREFCLNRLSKEKAWGASNRVLPLKLRIFTLALCSRLLTLYCSLSLPNPVRVSPALHSCRVSALRAAFSPTTLRFVHLNTHFLNAAVYI